MNVPLEIVIYNNYKLLLIHHNRAEGVLFFLKSIGIASIACVTGSPPLRGCAILFCLNNGIV